MTHMPVSGEMSQKKQQACMTHTPVLGEMSHKELLPVIKGVNNRIKQFSLLNQAPECTIDAVFYRM